MMSDAKAHIEEMRRAAAVDPETMVGVCEGGFPITADRCQFCGATWEDKCGRSDQGHIGKRTLSK